MVLLPDMCSFSKQCCHTELCRMAGVSKTVKKKQDTKLTSYFLYLCQVDFVTAPPLLEFPCIRRLGSILTSLTHKSKKMGPIFHKSQTICHQNAIFQTNIDKTEFISITDSHKICLIISNASGKFVKTTNKNHHQNKAEPLNFCLYLEWYHVQVDKQ